MEHNLYKRLASEFTRLSSSLERVQGFRGTESHKILTDILVGCEYLRQPWSVADLRAQAVADFEREASHRKLTHERRWELWLGCERDLLDEMFELPDYVRCAENLQSNLHEISRKIPGAARIRATYDTDLTTEYADSMRTVRQKAQGLSYDLFMARFTGVKNEVLQSTGPFGYVLLNFLSPGFSMKRLWKFASKGGKSS